MSGIFRCPCGQQFKVAVPAGGVKVKCPGCGKLLQLRGHAASTPSPTVPTRASVPKQAAAPQVPPTSSPARSAPLGQHSSDSLFGNLDVPASPSPTLGARAPLGTPAVGSSNPFPKRPTAASRSAAPKQGKSGKVLLFALGGVGGLFVLFMAIGVIAAIAGRSRDQAGVGGSPAATVAQSTTPVTADEAKDVAEKFAREIQTGSPFVANQMINWQSVVDNGLQGFDISDSNKSQFARGAVNGLRQRNWAQVIKTQTAGDVTLLRMRTKAGAPTALYRAKNTNGGVGYFEFTFYRDQNEKVGVSDVYVFQTGEWMSETIHRAAIPFIAHQNRSFLDKLSGQQSDYVKHHKEIETIGRMAHVSPRAAMTTYQNLPATLKGDKTIMILRIGIASKLNDDNEYQAAINDFMRKFPNDPAAQLFAIDYYALKQEMNSALKALQKLDQQVGGDPALQVLAAAVHVQQGDLPEAKSTLQKALERDPDYQDAKTMLAALP